MGTSQATRLQQRALPQGIACELDAAACQVFQSDADGRAGCRPHGILKARSSDEVQAILSWANSQQVGIVPVSSSGRHRRSDTVPQRDNTYMLDLTGMKRLVHADGRDRIVIIEPGVDFGSIDRLLQPHGLRAFRPLMPRAGKSVIASYLEREPLISPNEHWDVEDPFGGTHLVLGNGHNSPTGTAAMAGTLEERLARGHRHMVSLGHSNLDFLRVVQGAQGSLAVMTWAAVYCEALPVQETAWFCTADSLTPIINVCRDFLHRRLGNALFIVDRVQLAMMLARNQQSFDALCKSLPAWIAFISVSAGRHQPAAKMAWQSADVRHCAATHGVQLHDGLGAHRATDLISQLRSTEAVCFRDRLLGAHRELFFVQQLNRAEHYINVVHDTLTHAGLGDHPVLGVYIQPMAQGVNCHIEFTLAHAPGASPARDDAWQLAAQRCAKAGGFFSRPYERWIDFAFAGDNSSSKMLRAAKTLLDPNNIMNPGRLPY